MLSISDHIATAQPVSEESNVFKARRDDGQLSAVEVLNFETTPVQDEFFTRQAGLLAEAARHYHASVPAVLSWGFTQTGNFPFIESEWIDRFDVSQLPNRQKTVTINEIGDIAEQVSRVLTLCHGVGVVHSNIHAEHILWDRNKARYCLTGFRFGLTAAGDGPAGTRTVAAEPEDQLLKQKDIHDLGLVLFTLLRNYLLPINNGPTTNPGRSLAEIELKDGSTLPSWLANCINRALSTREDRFKSAHEMYSYIIVHHKTPFTGDRWFRSKLQRPSTASLRRASKTRSLRNEKLQTIVASGVRSGKEKMRFVFDRRIAVGLLVAAVLVGFSIIAQNRQNGITSLTATDSTANMAEKDTSTNAVAQANGSSNRIVTPLSKKGIAKKTLSSKKQASIEQPSPVNATSVQEGGDTSLGAYKVRSKAYFHNAPDDRTRRKGFIVHWNNAVLHPLKEENDYVYVVYTNHEGQTSRGWLRKKDLIRQ